jgi:cobalt-zinc-cadmium resistance protein CzcA
VLARLIEFCVHRRLAAIVGTLALAAYGLRACSQTPIEAFPDVTDLQVTVIAQMPGYAPEEIERQVTVPLERALNGTPGMTLLRSESLHGLALVTLTFDDAVDSFHANTLVAQRAATADLPPGVTPELAPDATPLGEIYQFVLRSDHHDLYQLRSELQWNVSRLLRQVPGVADVVEFGGFLKEVHVEADPLALLAHHLALDDVTQALEHSNLNVGGGFLRHGAQEFAVRGVGDLRTADDIKNVVLRSDGGTPVIIGDVARVVQSAAPRRGTVGMNGDAEVVEGFVWLRRGENPSNVLDGVHAKVAELNGGILPAGMHLDVFYDRTDLVDLSLETVHHNLALGFLLVVSVVWLFLRNLRASLVIATIIPLALLSAFTALYLLGLPANLISLGAVDFGILLDASIVLVENVVHGLHEERPATRREMLQVITRSAIGVAQPSVYAMTIIIAALLPVFTLQRVEGRIFRPLAFTYSAALCGALLERPALDIQHRGS